MALQEELIVGAPAHDRAPQPRDSGLAEYASQPIGREHVALDVVDAIGWHHPGVEAVLGPVSVLNVPEDDPSAPALRSLGATVVVRQHEMLLELEH